MALNEKNYAHHGSAMEDWSVSDVSRFLFQNGLEMYVAEFRTNNINGILICSILLWMFHTARIISCNGIIVECLLTSSNIIKSTLILSQEHFDLESVYFLYQAKM